MKQIKIAGQIFVEHELENPKPISYKWLCFKCFFKLPEEDQQRLKMKMSPGIDKCSKCRRRKQVHQVMEVKDFIYKELVE